MSKTSLQNDEKLSLSNNNEQLLKILGELEASNKEKDLINKENRQLQHKLKDKQTEIEKNREQIKSLSTDKIKLEITETSLHNQMDCLYDEIDYLKEELKLKEKEEQKKKTFLQELIDKGYDEQESVESLREKIIMLRIELNQNNENIIKAREVLKKERSFDECLSSMNMVLNDFEPKNNEQVKAINLLKVIFGFQNTKLTADSGHYNKDIYKGDLCFSKENDAQDSNKIG